MREVDEALARAYAQHEQSNPPQGVPPAPHLSARALKVPSHRQLASVSSESTVELQWPALVMTLEREWGERFEKMASLLLDAHERQGIKVLLFTSCHRAEGRTTLVLTLARALARHALRTLVVDADLTGPMVARHLGLRPEVGLDDVVESGLALSDALIDARDDHLGILPMRSAVSRPRDFLASPAWTCTLARLRREYDLILVDGGPLFTGLSAAVLHRSVDAAVLVTHRGMTGERAVLRAAKYWRRGEYRFWGWPRHSSDHGGGRVYETHFGLKHRPFGETVSPSVYVSVPSRDTVLRRLRYALEHGQAPAVLFGPAGSGKTLLARRLASELGGPSIHVTFPALSALEMVAHIAHELGGHAIPPQSLQVALRQVRDQLTALASRGQRPLLIIDDAHLIESVSTFDALRLLLNFATNGPPDLSLLFVGSAELLIELPAGLADRLAARCLLGPLAEDESFAYVAGRLATAGASVPLFSQDAIVALHRAADGLPRRLNRLADLALLIAYAQDLSAVDATVIAIAAREFHRDMAA